MRVESVCQLIGNTPCVLWESGGDGASIYFKLEGYNPTGSIKDRACYQMIKSLRERGLIRPGMTLLDASSGNFASSLSYFGRMMGHPVEVVVSSKLTSEKRKFIEYFCGRITSVGDFTIDGNRYCRELIKEDHTGKYCFLDQLHNWDNPGAYYQWLGPEILYSFPDVSMVIGSLGSGGTMLGVGKYIKERKPEARVVVVQALSGSRIPGVGSFDDGDYITPFMKRGWGDGIFDSVVKVDQQSACERVRQLNDKGIFCGLQTGAVMHAALQEIDNRGIKGDVVVISGDSGWKNMDKLSMLMHA